SNDEYAVSYLDVPTMYNDKKHEHSCANQRAPLKQTGGKIRLRILVDRGSIEVFSNDGQVALSVGVLLPTEKRVISDIARGGQVRVRSLEVFGLKSAWEK